MQETATINPARIAAGPVNETPLAFHETLAPSKRPIQPLLLNEGEAA